MELQTCVLKCWSCREENRILILPGTGAYQCNRCEAVILDTEPLPVPLPKPLKLCKIATLTKKNKPVARRPGKSLSAS